MNKIIICIFFNSLFFTSCDPFPKQATTAQESSAGDYDDLTTITIEPNFIPIKFSISKNGLKVSVTHSIMTFFGKFSLTYARRFFKKERPIRKTSKTVDNKSNLYENYHFSDMNLLQKEEVRDQIINSTDIVVLLIKSEKDVDVFTVSGEYRLEIISEGLQRTVITNEYVEIDLRYAKIREINMIKTETNVRTIWYNPDIENIELSIGDSVFYTSPELLRVEIEDGEEYRKTGIHSVKVQSNIDENQELNLRFIDSTKISTKSKTPY